MRVVESAMQLELSSRTETEQEARSKSSSCYNFETLSTQIFQCNCFFLLPLAHHQAIVRGATIVGNTSHKELKYFLEEHSYFCLSEFSHHIHEPFILNMYTIV